MPVGRAGAGRAKVGRLACRAMRTTHRTRCLLPTALLLAGLTLAGCTSGDDPQATSDPQTQAAKTDPTIGKPQPPTASGYLCRYVSPSTQRAVAGQELAKPLEVTTQDDTQAWVCESRDGEQVVLRTSVLRGAEQTAAARARMTDAGVAMEGPPYLGEAYLGERLATAVTRCRVIDSAGSKEYEPYALVVEAVAPGETDVKRELTSTLTGMASSLDQAVGCSPKRALEEYDQGAATTAP